MYCKLCVTGTVSGTGKLIGYRDETWFICEECLRRIDDAEEITVFNSKPVSEDGTPIETEG